MQFYEPEIQESMIIYVLVDISSLNRKIEAIINLMFLHVAIWTQILI